MRRLLPSLISKKQQSIVVRSLKCSSTTTTTTIGTITCNYHTNNYLVNTTTTSTTTKSSSNFLKTSSPFFTPDRIEELSNYQVINTFKSVDTDKISVPHYYDKESCNYSMKLEIHTNEQDVNKIRRVNKLAANVLKYASSLVKEGVTTEEIDEKVFNYIVIENGAYPSPLRYNKFPKSLCASVNEILVHGIPNTRPLKYSDLINLDITVYLDGFHGDTSKTFIVGLEQEQQQQEEEEKSNASRPPIKNEYKLLIQATREALWEGIKVCGPNVPLYKIGCAIDKYLSKFNEMHGTSFKSSPDYVGHGIGREFHGLPQIVMVKNKYGKDFVGSDKMKPGMVFTIEPVILTGSTKSKTWKSDSWTITAKDGCVNAQFEHTIRIRDTTAEKESMNENCLNGCEVLTLYDDYDRNKLQTILKETVCDSGSSSSNTKQEEVE